MHADSLDDALEPVKDINTRPIDHLPNMGLKGEEVAKVQQILRRYEIHDKQSALESINDLQAHIKDEKDEVTTLQQKSVDLDKADDNLAKAEKLLKDEKEKVRDSLSELIRQNEKDRAGVKARLDKRMKKIRQQEDSFNMLAEAEVLSQEKVAKKEIELELLEEAKADELEFKEDDLRQKDEHIKDAQGKLKKDRTHLRQYLSHVQKEEHKAKQVAKEWVERQRDRVSADKDAMLEKYLRSRQENEKELRLAQEKYQHHRKMRQVEAMKFDDEDDWDQEEEEDVRPVQRRHPHQHHQRHSFSQVSEPPADDDYDFVYPAKEMHRLEDLKRSIADDDDMLAEERHHRRGIPPYSVRAGRQASRERDSQDFDTSLVQTKQAVFEI